MLSLVACKSQEDQQIASFSFSLACVLLAESLRAQQRMPEPNDPEREGYKLDPAPVLSNTFKQYCTQGLARVLDFILLESNLHKY